MNKITRGFISLRGKIQFNIEEYDNKLYNNRKSNVKNEIFVSMKI